MTAPDPDEKAQALFDDLAELCQGEALADGYAASLALVVWICHDGGIDIADAAAALVAGHAANYADFERNTVGDA